MEGSSINVVYACCNVCLCVDCIQEAPVAVLERSVYSARYCFVKHLHERYIHTYYASIQYVYTVIHSIVEIFLGVGRG